MEEYDDIMGGSPEREDDNIDNIVRIVVFGVGGGGCNAIDRLLNANVKGVKFIAADTDMLVLSGNKSENKIQLGKESNHGLGAGSDPEAGTNATIEAEDQIREGIKDANLLFITAGMGGGTGTGGAHVVAKLAKELNILTIAVVTKPFNHEGKTKMAVAEQGIKYLREQADVLVIIPNENVYTYVKKDTPLYDLFQLADNVLYNCITGITNIVVRNSIIHLDFADVYKVMKGKGTAHIGVGHGKGENRIYDAMRQACSSPLLESDIKGATQLIVSLTGDKSMSGAKYREAMKSIAEIVAPDANIIQGYDMDENLSDEAYITIVATGFKSKNGADEEEIEKEKKLLNDNYSSESAEGLNAGASDKYDEETIKMNDYFKNILDRSKR